MNKENESPRLEINIPEKIEVVRLPDGLVVERTTYQTGSVRDNVIFPGDYPNARQIKSPQRSLAPQPT